MVKPPGRYKGANGENPDIGSLPRLATSVDSHARHVIPRFATHTFIGSTTIAAGGSSSCPRCLRQRSLR
jgi:hypothetical protein